MYQEDNFYLNCPNFNKMVSYVRSTMYVVFHRLERGRFQNSIKEDTSEFQLHFFFNLFPSTKECVGQAQKSPWHSYW